ncbi:HAMP domain-containing sensor histidine kinase [Dactylosporangium sp. NPDC000555]|uniref:sensor histidine kinase n=1 Tax=Dactylosporangium sp. NPDC000555 TaxID=3154260 RepID=UPI00332A2E32
MKSWPLRVKLVVLMLVLLAAALVTTGTAGVYSTRDYLLTRVDAQLLGSVRQAAMACESPGTKFGGPGVAPMQRNGYYVACIDRNGAIDERFFNPIATGQRRPALPATAEGIGPITRLDRDTIGAYATVSPMGGDGHQWRVLFARQPGGPGYARAPVVIAISLDDVDATVTRQLWTSVTIGAFVLVVLAVVAYLLVRSSLRPLVEVEQTAEAIAAGDLSRRVPEADPRTEIGGLSQALNTMLGQIETAFDERRASEEQARASEEQARASEDRMRRFIADASHELRTPLTSIRGFAELHRQAGKSDETIARIEHHATRMGLLVDDLLLLARMDQQRALEKRPVDLLSLATDALIDARVTATGHRLRLRTASSGDDEAEVEPPIVLGDGVRLRQVVQNLLSNALTHTPAGTEVTVFVGTEAEHAILEVSDNGPGMSAEDASRVFERFYRTDPSRTRALGGSGLGLSIVAALVAAHGGEVTLRTAPGEGATFRVSIPLLKATPQ